jgi:dTDP-4-dehydrorhamnose reductase
VDERYITIPTESGHNFYALNAHKPDALINCAAYTAVDQAEKEKQKARLINAEAVEVMAGFCRDSNIPFIHYSSDYVYHNGLNRPLLETDLTTPAGVYAKTKLEGDRAAINSCKSAYVLRTSWVFSPFGHNFLKTMLKLSATRDHLQVVCDQIGTPTSAIQLARASIHMLYAIFDGKGSPGIYNVSNAGVSSWYDFAKAIFRLQHISIEIDPVSTDAFPRPAPRPSYSVMDCSKFRETFKFSMDHWYDAIEECLELMSEGLGRANQNQ